MSNFDPTTGKGFSVGNESPTLPPQASAVSPMDCAPVSSVGYEPILEDSAPIFAPESSPDFFSTLPPEAGQCAAASPDTMMIVEESALPSYSMNNAQTALRLFGEESAWNNPAIAEVLDQLELFPSEQISAVEVGKNISANVLQLTSSEGAPIGSAYVFATEDASFAVFEITDPTVYGGQRLIGVIDGAFNNPANLPLFDDPIANAVEIEKIRSNFRPQFINEPGNYSIHLKNGGRLLISWGESTNGHTVPANEAKAMYFSPEAAHFADFNGETAPSALPSEGVVAFDADGNPLCIDAGEISLVRDGNNYMYVDGEEWLVYSEDGRVSVSKFNGKHNIFPRNVGDGQVPLKPTGKHPFDVTPDGKLYYGLYDGDITVFGEPKLLELVSQAVRVNKTLLTAEVSSSEMAMGAGGALLFLAPGLTVEYFVQRDGEVTPAEQGAVLATHLTSGAVGTTLQVGMQYSSLVQSGVAPAAAAGTVGMTLGGAAYSGVVAYAATDVVAEDVWGMEDGTFERNASVLVTAGILAGAGFAVGFAAGGPLGGVIGALVLTTGFAGGSLGGYLINEYGGEALIERPLDEAIAEGIQNLEVAGNVEERIQDQERQERIENGTYTAMEGGLEAIQFAGKI